ncbi:hypothetical protein L0F63_001176, partial [Massospora cicadina]
MVSKRTNRAVKRRTRTQRLDVKRHQPDTEPLPCEASTLDIEKDGSVTNSQPTVGQATGPSLAELTGPLVVDNSKVLPGGEGVVQLDGTQPSTEGD